MKIPIILIIFTLLAVPALAVLVPESGYAESYTAGNAVAVYIDPYTSSHDLRLDPSNALYGFDAVQTPGGAANDKFFALASCEWTTYTFGDVFWNVDGVPDIEFAEVTWYSNWHPEAALVYLTDAYVLDENGYLVPYGTQDDGKGYYAGIIWNKMPLKSGEDRAAIAASYYQGTGTRDFNNNVFFQDGNVGWSQLNLPDEVVCASGVLLVDITKDVYMKGLYPYTYENFGGSGDGYSLIVNEEGEVEAVIGVDGNTDGFDLDAIRVWKAGGEIQELPVIYGHKYLAGTDPAQGLAGWTIILEKYTDGSWAEVGRTTTDSTGAYAFTDLVFGTYRVSEVLQDTWSQVRTEGDATEVDGVNILLDNSDENNFYNKHTDDISYETAWAATKIGDIPFAGNNWATYVAFDYSAGSTKTYPIYAGQNTYVGNLVVVKDVATGNLKITFKGFTPTESHLQLSGVPFEDLIGDKDIKYLTKKGSPIPGQFEYSGLTNVQYTIPAPDNSGTIYIAAHCVTIV